jgi:hypothetical protein
MNTETLATLSHIYTAQCCGTVVIYCGSGFDFGKGSVPVQQKRCTKSCLFGVRGSIASQKVGLTFLIFLNFCIPFYVGSGSKYGSGMHSGCDSGFATAKCCGSCGSGSTMLHTSTVRTATPTFPPAFYCSPYQGGLQERTEAKQIVKYAGHFRRL